LASAALPAWQNGLGQAAAYKNTLSAFEYLIESNEYKTIYDAIKR
jgi:hypothetical protein